MTNATPHSGAQKFLFERSFDGMTQAEDTAPKAAPVYTQAQLDEARQAGFGEGRADALREASAQNAAAVAATAAQIDRRIEALLQSAADRDAAQKGDILGVTLAIAHKLLPHYTTQHGFGEIQSLVERALSAMSREPRLVIRVPDSLLDPLQQALNDIVTRQAYAGKVVLLADDTLGPNDCRIEWADGGMERDVNLVWQEIDRAAAETIGTPAVPQTPPHDTPAAEPVTSIEA